MTTNLNDDDPSFNQAIKQETGAGGGCDGRLLSSKSGNIEAEAEDISSEDDGKPPKPPKRKQSFISELSKTQEGRFYNLDVKRVSQAKVASIRATRSQLDKKKKKSRSKEKHAELLRLRLTESFLERDKDLKEHIKTLWHVGYTFKEKQLLEVSTT